MKTIIKTTAIFFAFSIVTSSCALFRGNSGGGHCPAYGSDINMNDSDEEIKTIYEIRENSISI